MISDKSSNPWCIACTCSYYNYCYYCIIISIEIYFVYDMSCFFIYQNYELGMVNICRENCREGAIQGPTRQTRCSTCIKYTST